jgi:hypothetical protein
MLDGNGLEAVASFATTASVFSGSFERSWLRLICSSNLVLDVLINMLAEGLFVEPVVKPAALILQHSPWLLGLVPRVVILLMYLFLDKPSDWC